MWRDLLLRLARETDVAWVAGARPFPDWIIRIGHLDRKDDALATRDPRGVVRHSPSRNTGSPPLGATTSDERNTCPSDCDRGGITFGVGRSYAGPGGRREAVDPLHSRQAGPRNPGRAARRGACRSPPARAVPLSHGPLRESASVLCRAFPIFARRLVENPAGRRPAAHRGPMGPTPERIDAGSLFRRQRSPTAAAVYRQGNPPGPGRGGSYRRGALQRFRGAGGSGKGPCWRGRLQLWT